MNHYSWEGEESKKPWFRSLWWFYLPLSFLFLVCLLLLLAYGYLYYQFAHQVEGYDLSKLETMESASLIYDRHGVEIGKIFLQNRFPIPFSDIPQIMVQAIIAQEDNRFFENGGVDSLGIVRAAWSNYRHGRIKQGASTVTQQLARNSFDLRARSIQRKIVEMFLAHRIERSLSKEKIMELYLNRVYFGSGFYGIQAASMGYFGKPAKKLEIHECALLAGLLKSPNALSPWNHPQGALRVRDFVLHRMNELGFLSKKQLNEELELPLGVQKRSNPFKVSYAIDFIRQQAIAALGYQRAMNGGVRIDTTLDANLQQVAEKSLNQQLDFIEKKKSSHSQTYAQYCERNKSLEDTLARGGFVNFPAPTYLQGALLALENHTGGILALVGGRNFIHSEYNRALQGRRPPGTLFTPLVAAAAYSKGISPATMVDDSPIDNHYVMIGGENGILGEWGVEQEENSYEGFITSEKAVAQGKNAASLRLGFSTGIETLEELSIKAGIHTPLRSFSNAYLGSTEMELEELTLAFSMFPGQGSRPEKLHVITKITDADGSLLFQTPIKRMEVISPEVAFQTHALLQRALHEIYADSRKSDLNFPFPSGGKSGTAYDFTDLWFIGYSSEITCGVWIGYDKREKIYRGAFGRDLALPIGASLLNASLKDFPPKPILPPATLHEVSLCSSSGLLPKKECQEAHALSNFYLTDQQIPKRQCTLHGKPSYDNGEEILPGEWPRALHAVDLATIDPILPKGKTLLDPSDLSEKMTPSLSQKTVASPLSCAEPSSSTQNKSKDPLLPSPSSGRETSKAEEKVPIEKAIPLTPEIRRAQPVHPLDFPTATPVMNLPIPKPIELPP